MNKHLKHINITKGYTLYQLYKLVNVLILMQDILKDISSLPYYENVRPVYNYGLCHILDGVILSIKYGIRDSEYMLIKKYLAEIFTYSIHDIYDPFMWCPTDKKSRLEFLESQLNIIKNRIHELETLSNQGA